MSTSDGPSGGFLGARHVALWTILGGMAAVLGIFLTLVLSAKSDGSSRPPIATAPVVEHGPSQQQEEPSNPITPASSQPHASAQAPIVEYLSDLTAVGGTRGGGGNDVTIDGIDYPHSVVMYCMGSDVTGQQDNNVEYNIGLKGRQFTGLVGIGDAEDASGIAADVSFYGDGNLLKTATVKLGHPELVHFSLAGILRLEIRIFIAQSIYDGRSINVSVANARFSATN